jgi:hypothetical protein
VACKCRLAWIKPPRWIPTSHVLVGVAPEIFAAIAVLARQEHCEPEVIVREALSQWMGMPQ